MKRILIIAYYWPPLNAIGSHRPYWWARRLVDEGAQVTVLTSRKYAFDGGRDLKLPPLPKLRVIEVPYLGVKGALASVLSRTPLWQTMKTLYRRAPVGVKRGADPRKRWRIACSAFLEGLARDNDVVISTFSPAEGHQIASEIKAINPRMRWIADYRDMWSLEINTSMTADERAALSEHELQVVGARADHVVSVSDEFVLELSTFLSLPGTTIMNGHDAAREEIERRVRAYRERPPGGTIRIIYSGTIYPATQDASPLLHALAALEAEVSVAGIRFAVEFYGREMEHAQRFARNLEFGHFVQCNGYRSRADILKLQSGADALLLLEGSRANDKGVLTGKLFEYISAGVPVLSLGSMPGSAIHRVIVETKTGICAGNSQDEIENFLRALSSGEIRRSFSPDIDRIATYHRATQAQKLLKIVENGG